LSDMGETTTVAGTETPAQAPQPVDVPQTQSSRRGDRWFTRGVRSGIIAAVVVVVAGAFFTIGWFTSTRGEHARPAMRYSIDQRMNMHERGRGMVPPQEGRGQGQIVPTPQPPSNGQPDQQGQSAQQGYLGVGVVTVTPALQQQYGLSRSNGVLVASIDGSGPAFKAGVQRGDVITSIDGAPVAQQEDVIGLIAKMKAGDSVTITIDRNGQNLTFQVTLGGRSASVSG
jgi:membrane-associated protease RseP (regulator of RpoE activity)